jgi:hypothetical protein
MFLSSAPI